MKLPDTVSVDDLETEYLDWSHSKSEFLEFPIELPTQMPFCVEASLLQALISVSRRMQSNFRVRLNGLEHDVGNYDEIVKKALGNIHVLTAWIMSTNIEDQTGHALQKSDSHIFSKYLDAMDAYDFPLTHGSVQSRVNLICVQGAKREFIQPIYHQVDGAPVVRPYSEIRLLIQDVLTQLSPEWTGKELREISIPIAQLIKELIENSDWWARTDEHGKPYKKGIRAVSFRLLEIDDENASTFAGTNAHIHNYLQTILLNHGYSDRGSTSSKGLSIKKNSFVEISIVDSGPGLVRRWLSSLETDKQFINNLSEISLENEESALIECFKKWATSSHNSLRGVGLFSVAQLLQEKNGFMRLRTGRLAYLFGTKSAIKDVAFKVKKEMKSEGSDHNKLSDGTHVFTSNGEIVFFLKPWNSSTLSAMEGTSFSIILPV